MRNRWSLGVLVLFILSVPVLAQQDMIYEYQARGIPSPSNSHTMITLKMMEGHANAVLIYSEPSHTLLTGFFDNSNEEPTEQAWFHGLLPKGTPAMFMNLSKGVQGTVSQGLLAPERDTYFTIDTLVDYEGAVRTRTFRVNSSPRTFYFGLGWERPTAQAEALRCPECGGSWFTCLYGEGGGCDYARAYCAEDAALCCRETQIPGCGWCGRMKVQCGTASTCSTCPGV